VETEVDCTTCRGRLSALLDAELEGLDAQAVRDHVRGCAGCRQQLDALRALQFQVRAHPLPLPDLAPLAAQVRAALPARPTGTPRRCWPRWLVSAWPVLACGVTCAALAGAAAVLILRPSAEDVLGDLAVSAYLRAQHLDTAEGLVSSDPAQASVWLERHLGHAVRVPDLQAHGFALEGVRVDFLYHQPVAALAYRAGGQVVQVFLWPRGSEPALHGALSDEGLQIRFWSWRGEHRCAISAMDAGTLQRFVAGFDA
jgi:anti-sigma factor RsiW